MNSKKHKKFSICFHGVLGHLQDIENLLILVESLEKEIDFYVVGYGPKEKLLKDGIKVTFLPFLIKALTHALKEMPEFNSSLDSSSTNLVIKKYINIGIAVDTPTGLVVPVISNADQKSISDLSIELVDISNRARNKKLKPAELKGGTFTISSLGGIGGSFFTPIINPPEVAIIGVSQSVWKNTFNRNEKKSELKYIMPFSLSDV